MSTTVDEVSELLDTAGIRHQTQEFGDSRLLVARWNTSAYRNPHGQPSLTVLVAVEEDGELIRLLAPQAFSLATGEVSALTGLADRFPLVRFEIDPADGEVRPTVMLPLEDARPTPGLLSRACGELVGACEAAAALITPTPTPAVDPLAVQARRLRPVRRQHLPRRRRPPARRPHTPDRAPDRPVRRRRGPGRRRIRPPPPPSGDHRAHRTDLNPPAEPVRRTGWRRGAPTCRRSHRIHEYGPTLTDAHPLPSWPRALCERALCARALCERALCAHPYRVS